WRLANNDLPSAHAEWTRLVRVLERYMARCLGNIPREDKRDVVQDLLKKISKKGRLVEYPRAWTARVASNKATEYWRRKRQEPRTDQAALERSTANAAEPWMDAVDACLSQLPEDELTVIIGQFFAKPKVSLRELATELGYASADGAARKKKRAIERLRHCLEDQPVDWDRSLKE
ncbi:MAG: RNA polymerase sigma factor, partial [Planctomycetota bacterium]